MDIIMIFCEEYLNINKYYENQIKTSAISVLYLYSLEGDLYNV